MKRFWKRAALLMAGAALVLPGSLSRASSHSDAPLIKLDPQANLTDVYAFRRDRPDGTKALVVEVSVRPFSEPGDGVSYEAFSDDALYSIHITDPNTGAQLQRYDFRFSPVDPSGAYKNLDTILRYGRGANNSNGTPNVGAIMDVGDAHQNFVQTYTLTKTANGATTVVNMDSSGATLKVPPANTGPRTTPFYNHDTMTDGTPPGNPAYGFAISGATARNGLDTYTKETTYDLANGLTTFCGTREDGFYADIPGIFDFLDPRILNPNPPGFGQAGNGVDGFKGFNVLHYAIVIPLSQLPDGIAYQGAFTGGMIGMDGNGAGAGNRQGVGVYASVSRPRVTLRSTSTANSNSGPFIQVNREANPLFNEALVALRDKDNYNRTSPVNDANYAKYALNPEIAVLINAVFSQNFATTNRTDLMAVYIPDVIRVDTTTGPTHVAGDGMFNRLSVLGGDTITNNVNGVSKSIPAGWPNGRRFGDDVVDIALTALASGPSYKTITLVGDNIDHNDQVYNRTFPYAGTPHSGTRNRKDSDPATASNPPQD